MEPDIEWKDGDDAALYDEGYETAKQDIIKMIEKVLQNEDVDRLPTRMALRVLMASINLTD